MEENHAGGVTASGIRYGSSHGSISPIMSFNQSNSRVVVVDSLWREHYPLGFLLLLDLPNEIVLEHPLQVIQLAIIISSNDNR